MAVWTVFEPEWSAGQPPARRAERLVFVREAFSWSSVLFAPIVLLVHRLWLGLLFYVLLLGAIAVAVVVLDLGRMGTVLGLLPNLLVAFNLPDLRRRKLRRRGHDEIGAVVGRDIEEAESRFLDGWLSSAAFAAPPPPAARPAPAGVIGLFPEAAGR